MEKSHEGGIDKMELKKIISSTTLFGMGMLMLNTGLGMFTGGQTYEGLGAMAIGLGLVGLGIAIVYVGIDNTVENAIKKL